MPDTPRPKDFPALPSFDDAKYYAVKLYRAAHYAGRDLSPADTYVMRGDVCKEIGEAVYSAEESKEP